MTTSAGEIDEGPSVPSSTAERMNNRKGWCYERKFALASIALSLLEIGSFILARLLIMYSLVNSQPYPSPGVRGATIYRVLAGIVLFGTPLALISALLALGFDSRAGSPSSRYSSLC